MATWFWWAVVAAVLYGAHQIFTRFAADHIGEGLGGFAVESIAALTILIYLVGLWLGGRWNQKFSNEGFYYSALTGICVGAGTIAFFLLFPKGSPAFLGASNPRGWRGDHGGRWNSIFSRARIMATAGRHHPRGCRAFSLAEIIDSTACVPAFWVRRF